MIINYERITKNLTQFILDMFKNKLNTINESINSIKSSIQKETFESFSKNLKSYDFKLNFNNNKEIESIEYSVPETGNKIIKTLFRDNEQRVIRIELDGDIPTNLEFNRIKNIIYENSNYYITYSN